MGKIIDMLTTFKMMGFEVIKSNYGQIAMNDTKGKMPLVLINDYGYLTPTPNDWYLIDDEIKRLEDESK